MEFFWNFCEIFSDLLGIAWGCWDFFLCFFPCLPPRRASLADKPRGRYVACGRVSHDDDTHKSTERGRADIDIKLHTRLLVIGLQQFSSLGQQTVRLHSVSAKWQLHALRNDAINQSMTCNPVITNQSKPPKHNSHSYSIFAEGNGRAGCGCASVRCKRPLTAYLRRPGSIHPPVSIQPYRLAAMMMVRMSIIFIYYI